MKNMIKNLYIIGNGFDIYHGLNSRYSDYCKWLNTHIYTYDVYNKLHAIYDIADENDWWIDFEQNLSKINFDYLAKVYEENIYELGTDDFCDADNHRGFVQVEIDICDILNSVKLSFCDWIKELNLLNVDRSLQLEIRNSFFLTFNYTKTLENVYDISKKQILHIHGCIDNQDFVLGHGKSQEDLYKALKGPQKEIPKGLTDEQLEEWQTCNCDDVFMDSIIEASALYLSKMKKNVEQIIRKNKFMFENLESVEKVYVLGFSFSSIDVQYLAERLKYMDTGKVVWIVSAYSEKDKSRINNFIKLYSLDCNLWKIVSLDFL